MGAGERSRGTHGASAVEFALVLPVLVLFLFGIIQFGLAFNRSQGMHAAAREGARLASIGADLDDVESMVGAALDGTVVNAADVTIEVRRYGDGIDPTDKTLGVLMVLGVEAACNGTAAAHSVRVDVEITRNVSDYAITIPLWGSSTQTFPSDGIFRCEA